MHDAFPESGSITVTLSDYEIDELNGRSIAVGLHQEMVDNNYRDFGYLFSRILRYSRQEVAPGLITDWESEEYQCFLVLICKLSKQDRCSCQMLIPM